MEYSTVKTMKSLVTKDTGTCFVPDCGCKATDCHHIYEGRNKRKSEKYNLMIPLCHVHHSMLHNNQDMNDYFKRLGQIEFEAKLGTREQFIRIIGRNYLE